MGLAMNRNACTDERIQKGRLRADVRSQERDRSSRGVCGRLNQLPVRFGILGHHHHLTRARPDFSGKLGERIAARVTFRMAFGAQPSRSPPEMSGRCAVQRQRLNAGIFLSRTMAVQLDGVKVPAMRGEEAAKLTHVLVVTTPARSHSGWQNTMSVSRIPFSSAQEIRQ